MADSQEQNTPSFSTTLVSEAASVATNITDMLKERPEAKGITIDGPTSKDPDDAFWLEKALNGGYTLFVSIADVGSFITPHQTPHLEREAYARSFTHYYATGNRPMLPRSLSEDNLSLVEGQARPAITVMIPFDRTLSPGEPTIAQTWISSAKRFSYSQVEDELDSARSAFSSMLKEAYTLARALLQRRQQRGALALFDLVSGWTTTEEGFLRPLEAEERFKAQIITGEFMLLANQSFATFLSQRGIPALYRNHAAKVIAPDRHKLVEMIETTISHPESVPPERIRATFNLSLERANYAPTVEGHFGLNLPVYTHMTSPLRRYPDLLNQRILLAFLKGTGSEASREDLIPVAAHINQEERRIKEGKSAYLRSVYERQVQQTRSEQALPSLDKKTFHTLLRIAAEQHTLEPAIETETYRRLEAQLLEVHDIYTLVFRYQNTGDAWMRLKQTVLHGLRATPHDAVSLLFMGRQSLKWGEPTYEVTSGTAEQATFFQARAQVTIAGKMYQSSFQVAPQKERAKQFASLEVLTRIAGVTPFSPSPEEKDAELPPHLEQEEVSATPHNYKGELQELAQAHRCEPPVYREIERSGPSHAPLFQVEASLSIEAKEYRAQGSGTTKGQAEQRAAQALLQQVPTPQTDLFPLALSEEKKAVSVLNELRQKAVIRDITYTYEALGLSHMRTFHCSCCIVTADTRTITAKGTGASKKEAAQEAASQVLTALLNDENKN